MTSRTRTCALAAALILTTAGGCGFVQDARTVVDSATVLGEFVNVLGQAPERSYTAEYSTSGGRSVTVVQSPSRTAYLVTGARLVVTPEQLLRCSPAGCEQAPSPGGDVAPLVGGVTGPGFVPADVVLATVATAAFAKGARVETSSRTVLGRPVFCGNVTGLERPFAVCVTDEGVVASFNGERGSMELRSFTGTADAAAFVPPPGSAVVDVPSLR